MANEKHLYLTVAGDYVSAATPLAGEIWQFGVRLALVFGDVDDIGTLPNNWDPVNAPQHNVETDWTTDSNWDISGPLTSTFDPCSYLTNHAMPAIETFIATSTMFSASVQLRYARLYPIGPTGHAVPAPPYAQGSPALGTWTGTLPTGGASGTSPAQVSCVFSLLTNQTGRRGRGRMYGPMPGTGVTGTGGDAASVTSANRTTWVTAAKGFLEDLAVTSGGPTDANVAPIVTGAPWTNYAKVQQVRVGSVLDTQQRRRRQMTEVYTSATVDV